MTFDGIKDMRIGSKKVLSAWLDGKQIYPGAKRILDSLILWVDPKKQQATNESMAKNPKLIDLSGNGHDIDLFNFSWSGMSGIGGYNLDASLISPNQSDIINMEVSGSTVTYSRVDSTLNILAGRLLLFVNIIKNDLPVNEEYGIKAGEYGVVVHQTEPANTANITLLSLQPYETGKFTINQGELDNGKMMLMFGNSVEIPAGGSGSFELLPLYPDALVSDGVDDYGMVSGLPILTKERGFTVISDRDNTSFNNSSFATKRKSGDSENGAFQFERFSNSVFSFGRGNIVKYPSGISYMTSKEYNRTPLEVGDMEDTDTLTFYRLTPTSGDYGSKIMYSFLLFDRDLTDAEIEWVKENMVEADGVMVYDWMDSFRLHNTDATKRCDGTLTSCKITVTDVYTTSRFFESILRAYEYYNSYKIKVTGLPAGVKLKYTADDTVIFEISSDGVYMLPAIDGTTYNYVGFQFDNTFESENVTIQQLLTPLDQHI